MSPPSVGGGWIFEIHQTLVELVLCGCAGRGGHGLAGLYGGFGDVFDFGRGGRVDPIGQFPHHSVVVVVVAVVGGVGGGLWLFRGSDTGDKGQVMTFDGSLW